MTIRFKWCRSIALISLGSELGTIEFWSSASPKGNLGKNGKNPRLEGFASCFSDGLEEGLVAGLVDLTAEAEEVVLNRCLKS